jgi:hypothetical protein
MLVGVTVPVTSLSAASVLGWLPVDIRPVMAGLIGGERAAERQQGQHYA